MQKKKTPVLRSDGRPICGCKTRAGTRCQNPPVTNAGPPNHRCRMHGGNASVTHAGPLNPNWKGGISKPRYDGPGLFNDFVAESMADPLRLELDAEIGVVYALTAEEIARLKANGATGAWSDLKLLYNRLVAGMTASDSNAIRENLLAIGDLAKRGVDDDRCRNRILRLIERRRRLVESQRKREAELNLTLTRSEIVKFAQLFLETVTRHVFDAPTLKAITDEFRAVLSGDPKRTIH